MCHLLTHFSTFAFSYSPTHTCIDSHSTGIFVLHVSEAMHRFIKEKGRPSHDSASDEMIVKWTQHVLNTNIRLAIGVRIGGITLWWSADDTSLLHLLRERESCIRQRSTVHKMGCG